MEWPALSPDRMFANPGYTRPDPKIGRSGYRLEREKGLDHALHLILGGCAVARHGLLDLVGRVLDHLAAGRFGFGQGQAAGLSHRHRRSHVRLEEHSLDHYDIRVMLSDQRPNRSLHRQESGRQRRLGRRGDHSVADRLDAASVRAGRGNDSPHETKAAARQTGVDS